MIFYIYKTSLNKKYYIGRHQTDNFDDNYFGSGKWVKSIKNKTLLSKEILEFCENENDLKNKELQYILENFNDPNCMNFIISSNGFDSTNNPSKTSERRKEISENTWFKTEECKKFLKENNPSKRDDVKIKRSEQLKMQWEDQEYRNTHSGNNHHTKKEKYREFLSKNNPMHDEQTTKMVSDNLKKRAKEEPFGFLKPEIREISREINRKRMLENNPMKNPKISAKLKCPKPIVECPHCNKIGGGPSMYRYHFNKCKFIKTISK
jgi:hypothetical protein